MPVLRPYQDDDYSQIINLFLLNTPAYFHPAEQQDLEEYLRTELEYYSVIEENGKILACGGCNTEDSKGCLSWYIVHPEHHGKGLGRQLAEHNLNILKSLPKVKKIGVRTSQLTYHFYEKFGFVLINTEDNFWGPGIHLYEMKLP